jgi:hypothetical protein
MKEVLEYVAREMRKLQINFAEIQPYDDRQTILITKETVYMHNNKLLELSDILRENIDGNAKSN